MKKTSLWTALITPMKNDGSVHFPDLEKLAKRQEEAGNGILLIGSTGEGLALEDEEKREIVSKVSEMNLAVPVMAGVGGFNLKNQIEWISYCNDLQIDAFLLVTPLYSKPGPVGQELWFRELMDSSQKPCMIYNIPSRTGIELPLRVVKNLESHKNFWAIKESSGTIHDYKNYRNASNSIEIYSGDDAMLPNFVPLGCDGLVSVSANVWPEATRLYVELCMQEKTESLFPLWHRALKAMFTVSNPIPAKVMLHQKKIIETTTLRPPLTEQELTRAEDFKEIDTEILNWYNSNKK
ncbi:MAG: 4-hydroxy-tetrahydrodipicolinate synthase [Balneolaceae bacterium]